MIGIICALAIEIDNLIDKMENTSCKTIAKTKFIKGEINKQEIVVAMCGVGKVNAAMCTQIMIDYFKPTLIINSGIAGALSEELSLGDTVIATGVIQHDMNTSALGDPIGAISFPEGLITTFQPEENTINALERACKKSECKCMKGIIVSGDLFVSSTSQRVKLRERFDALACEMEGASIGHIASRNQVDFAVFRTISDDLKHNKGIDFNEFKEMAAEKSIKIMLNFLENLS